MAVTINASTSSGLVQTADTSGTVEIQSNGTTKFTVASTGAYGSITQGTAVASTSGTSIDFTSIPSWVKRITVMFNGVSTNGTSNYMIQLGSTTFTTSGYLGGVSHTGSSSYNSTGFNIYNSATAASLQFGSVVLTLLTGNTWVENGILMSSTQDTANPSGGSIALGGTLDRVRITTVGGTDTFDAGSINILYEG